MKRTEKKNLPERKSQQGRLLMNTDIYYLIDQSQILKSQEETEQ